MIRRIAGCFLCLLGGCAQTQMGGLNLNSAGVCKVSDTNIVNTYEVFGAWKKIDGYNPTRQPGDLELNYDIFIIERGKRMCGVSVVNGGQSDKALFKSDYTHDVDNHQLNLTNSVGTIEGNAVAYSFTGSCGDTKMFWTYPDGHTDTFKIFNKDSQSGICDPSQ